VFHGIIGSWNTLLRDHVLRDRLASQHNLRAIEMEGAGTAEAVWQFGKSYLIVRGICDYGDDRTKGDRWHGYAAAAAAAYAKSLLLRLVHR
jgi:nucleoside phosphorylase